MLSIIPFDRVTSTAVSRAGDPERPFKAYPRTPVSVPAASSYYGPFTPPTFVGSVNIPASHTSTSLKGLEDTTSSSRHSGASSTMDHHHQAHSYSGYSTTADHVPHLMDISGHPSHHSFSRHHSSHAGMGMTIPNTPVSIKSELHHSSSSATQHSATNLSMHHNTSPTAQGSSSSSSLGSSSTPINHSSQSHLPGLYHGGAGGASHHSAAGSSAASSGSPPGQAPLGTAAGHSSSNDSSPGGSSNNDDDSSTSRMPPKKRPLSVPEDAKDACYWEKRKKNNESAKRSRDARRMKEEQIAMRVVYLEQENLQLRTEVSLLKNEIEKLRCMLYNS